MQKIQKSLSILLSFIMIISLFSIVPVTANAADGIEYIYRSWDNDKGVLIEETRTCTSYTLMTNLQSGKSHTLQSGWYIAGNMTFGQLKVNGDVHIIVPDGVYMKVTKGIGIFSTGFSLSIYGQSQDSGVLDVTNSTNDAAAIGSNDYSAHGPITIYGGTVKAESDDDAAAIGSGRNYYAGRAISIYGGKVTAQGSSYGAGIGTGSECAQYADVYIYGGEVNATGGKRGAGIGGGHRGVGANVRIRGGKVTATGGEWGAGIGGGNNGYGNTVVITGGEVTAIGGKGAAGIGGGDCSGLGSQAYYGKSGLSFSMNGGKVTAIGGDEAAGIGGGNEEDSTRGSISIHGGEVIATGGTNYGAGIGGGDQTNGFETTIGGGKITATGGIGAAGIGGGDKANGDVTTIFSGTVIAAGGKDAAGIGGGNGGNSGVVTIKENANVTATGGVNGAGIGNGNNGPAGGEVNIESGTATVTATGGDYAAGIGGGNTGADFCAVNISGSTVKANGGYRAAGIGGGDKATTGSVTITGGEVEAKGGKGGAGIGKGTTTNNDTITLNLNGGDVDATGGQGIFHQPQQTSIKCAPAIGGTYFTGNINLRGGNITAHGSFDEHIDSTYSSSYTYGYGTAIGSNSDNERAGKISIFGGVCVDTDIVNPDNRYSFHYYAKDIVFNDNENGCSIVQYDDAYALVADRVKALGWKADLMHIMPCVHGEYMYEDTGDVYHKESCRYCSLYEMKEHNDVLTDWVWSSGNTAATAKFTCADCGHNNYVEATVQTHISSEGDRFEASVEHNGKGYSTVRVTDSSDEIIEDGVVVTWENTDGTILESKVVQLGDIPEFTGSTPVKPGEDSIRYSFVGWSDGDANFFTGEDLPEATTQTLYTPIYKFRNETEPYINASGEYIPGKEKHYLIFNEYFEINEEDNSVGVMLDSVDISDFEFQMLDDRTYRINRYTGPTDNLTELVIPKSFKDNPVTVVGNDIDDHKLFTPQNGSDPQFTLVLNENIKKIGRYAFFGLNVEKVTGDTSALSQIGSVAFSYANNAGENALDFKLDYPGKIICGDSSFNNVKLTARVKHATYFDSMGSARSISYVFTDEHVVTPGWHWADDYSSATATFDCSDSRCKFNETHEATVTSKAVGEELTYTATVTAMGETFTDTKTIANYHVMTVDSENGKIETDVQNASEGDPVNVTITPDKGYHLSNISAAKDNRVPLTAVRGGIGAEGESFDKLVDGDKSTMWRMNNEGNWTIIMKADQKVRMASYSLTTGNTVSDDSGSNWKSWTISGGNFANDYAMEGAIDPGWHPLSEVVEDKVLQPVNNKTYDFLPNNPVDEYKYYLIRVYENCDSNFIQMSEFELKTEEVEVELSGEGDTRSFTMPAFSVIVSAAFEPDLHTVTWLNENGIELEKDENVPYGSTPEFSGTVPTKTGCTFAGWSDGENTYAPDALPAVSGDVTYTAVYTFDDGIGARLVGHSISLEGDIGVNFYMELSDTVLAHSDTAYMHFTIPNSAESKTKDILLKDARTETADGKTYYIFKCGVAAKEMTSQIKAQIIDGDKTGTEYPYSIKEYADYLLKNANENGTELERAYAAAAPLVKAMLNYGSYSQIYFDKNPTNLANADLDEADKVLGNPDISIADENESNLPEGVTFEGATLSLKSETTLSLYFKSSTELEFSCAGYAVEKVTSGNYQIARIRGIKSKDIGNILTLTINGTGTVTYSPLNYCKKAIADNTQKESLQNAVKALYLYWQSASSYFQ